ncbi:MAG TPA: glycosyltransferase 87 family protein [Solirubrobacteraceae bacterium]|nr:glycosyltransferase 87 family protein [Solirubrobacteraceae bacterium]
MDFRFQYWLAGWNALHGVTPYPTLHATLNGVAAFPYPASTAIFFVPFALLPQGISGDLFTAVCLSAPLITLWVLRVRDWRLYGLVMLLGPVVAGWQTANLTLLLGLGLACLWRFRDRPVCAGVLAALLVSLKPFLWPVLLWLAVTRRWRAAFWAMAAGAVIQILSWGIVGFDQIPRFIQATLSVTHLLRGWGYSVASTAMQLGAGSALASVLAIAVPALLALALLVHGFRSHAEPAGLVLVVALAICASPIVWTHYFALFVVPIAVLAPRLSLLWACLLPMWACPVTTPRPWQSALALLTFAGLVCLLLWVAQPGALGRRAFVLARVRSPLAEPNPVAATDG